MQQIRGFKWLTVLLLMTGCFLYFRFAVPYHTGIKEHIQLFIFSSSHMLPYFFKPAVIACLGGDFLTQFLYFKSGGAIVITLLLAAEWRLIYLTFKRFPIVDTWHAASLLPVIIECICLPHLSFSLALPVSFILALSTFLAYARTTGKISILTGILLIPVLYLTGGASVFLFLILAILYDIHCRQRSFVYGALLAGLAFAVPVIFKYSFLLTIKQVFLYPYPDITQGISLVTLALLLTFLTITNVRPFGRWAIPALMTSLLIAGLVKTTDRNQENRFGISIEAYHNNWDKVLAIAEKADLKNPVATCYTNMALSQKSLLGERIMDFYQPFVSGLLPEIQGSGWFTLFAGCDAYYHIGDLEMAQHAAMIGMLFSPGQRSARMVERLAEISIVTGDTLVAKKYLRMLESTLFHKVKPDILLKNKPHQGVFRKDIIRTSDEIQPSLELLVESDPENIRAVNYLLCYYLLRKDIPSFFRAYTSYCKGMYNPAPKAYAEALLIYFAAMKRPVEELTEYRILPEVFQSFGEYTRLYEDSDGNLIPVQEQFPNTYWLFYHFAIKND